MADTVLGVLEELARLRGIDLAPDWSAAASPLALTGAEDLVRLCELLGWPTPTACPAEDLRVHEFPLLAYHNEFGWAVAHRLEAGHRIVIAGPAGEANWQLGGNCTLYDVTIPQELSRHEHPGALSVFLAAIRRRKGHLVTAGIATIVINIIALVTSIFSMQVYDRVVPRGAFSTLWVLSLGTLAALAFDYVLRTARARMMEEEAAHIDTEVSEYFFARANDVRLDARPASIGTMAAQLRGLEQIRAMISSSTLFLLTDLPFALLFILFIAMLGGPVAVVPLVSFPISLGLALLVGRMIRADTQAAQVCGNKKNGILVEAFDAAETIKANRGGWFMLARWNRLLEEVHASELPVKNLQALSSTLFGTIQQIAYVAMIAWGAVEVYNNNMTMGALIACSILSGRINGPLVGQLPALVVQWSYSRASLQMLDGIMQLPPERPAGAELLRPSRLAGAIQLRGVTFSYPGARSGIAIENTSIQPGERVAIIGAIGSGKSTLLRLLAGLYAPAQGTILIDRLDMSQVAEDVLRANIGYLPQDYRLINGTLRDNITLGLAYPGDDKLMQAAELTGLSRLISAHPLGVDLPISEGGRGLSGGQRVLTGMTRLMLSRPRLWLLDEPTASLDPQTEAHVLAALQRTIAQDATLVMVTHKLQLLSLVSRVIVMANGKIEMDGPTQEILARLKGTQPRSDSAGQGSAKGAEPTYRSTVVTVPIGGVK